MGGHKEGTQKTHMILPPITTKEKEIITNIHRFRFLTLQHIQKLLNNKDPRNIKEWIKNLRERNYIGMKYDTENNNIPAKYYLSKNGIRWLKTKDKYKKHNLKKFYSEKNRSEEFINKCLLILDIYITLQNQAELSSSKFEFYTQSDYPEDGVIKDLNPTFGYIKETAKKINHYSCELFDEKMPRYAVRGRITKYIEFFSEDDTPAHILFVSPNIKLNKYIDWFIRKRKEEDDIENLDMRIATYQEITGKDIDEIWKKVE